jgi:hypothetical protein
VRFENSKSFGKFSRNDKRDLDTFDVATEIILADGKNYLLTSVGIYCWASVL